MKPTTHCLEAATVAIPTNADAPEVAVAKHQTRIEAGAGTGGAAVAAVSNSINCAASMTRGRRSGPAADLTSSGRRDAATPTASRCGGTEADTEGAEVAERTRREEEEGGLPGGPIIRADRFRIAASLSGPKTSGKDSGISYTAVGIC